MGRFKDLTDMKFGRLTALKRVEDYISPNGTHKIQWLCKCECGNETVVLGQSLTGNLIKSCGCLQKEMGHVRGKERKKYNQYDLSGEYGIGYTSKGESFCFDLEDYDKIKEICWFITSNGYVKGRDTNTGKYLSMHRFVMDCPNNMVVDHIDHNTTNNRKNNLRICTQHENTMNCKIPTNNTSGTKGVSYDSFYQKWNASIRINYKNKNLGYFDSIENAIKARREAEKKYFGEYSCID